MPACFFDSSALAKRYHPEEGSAKVAAIFLEPDRRIIISHLTIIEIRSMIAGKVRSGVLTPAEATNVASHFKSDLASGAIDVFAISAFDYRRAEDLLAPRLSPSPSISRRSPTRRRPGPARPRRNQNHRRRRRNLAGSGCCRRLASSEDAQSIVREREGSGRTQDPSRF